MLRPVLKSNSCNYYGERGRETSNSLFEEERRAVGADHVFGNRLITLPSSASSSSELRRHPGGVRDETGHTRSGKTICHFRELADGQ